MILAKNSLRNVNTAKSDGSALERLRSITYSMDTLIPGFYVWFGSLTLQVGGCKPDDEPYRYPGAIHSRFGIALVLPGYRIFTTYSGSYDPRQAQN
jgi:hypothetical protein